MMPAQPISSIESAISFGEKVIAAMSDSAKLDCQILLSHVLDKPTTYLYTWPEQLLTQAQIQQYTRLLARRENGEPIAYIVGYKEFWSLNFKVSPATLIPRPDTELLVEQILADHDVEHLSCLDLGTGTGAIALALASEKPFWKIDAVDFSQQAVELAQDNAKQLQLGRVNIFQSHWFENIPSASQVEKYQIIVSNPPYIDPQDDHLLIGDVRFEPKSALIAEQQGMADIRYIIQQAQPFLSDDGWLYFEHGYDQAEAVREAFLQEGYHDINTKKDYNGNDRITYACYKNKPIS